MMRIRSTTAVRFYFLTQFLATIATETCLHFYGWDTDAYRTTYCCATGAILAASWLIVRSTAPSKNVTSLAALQAVLAFALGVTGLTLPGTLDQWILLASGSCVLFMGVCLAFGCKRLPHVHAALAIFWLSLSGYMFVMALGTWPWLNLFADVVSYWLAIATFSWICFYGQSGMVNQAKVRTLPEQR